MPVHCCTDVEYVTTVFSYAKVGKEMSMQKEEHQRKIDGRRQVTEAAELDGKNIENAAECLLLHEKVGLSAVVGTESSQKEKNNTVIQASFVPYHPISTFPFICNVPRHEGEVKLQTHAVSSQLKANDECIRFYTGLISWDLFHHYESFLCTCHPNLKSSLAKLSPTDGLLLLL